MHTRYDLLFKYECIQEYLGSKWSLRKLAQEKSVHFTTLQRWLNDYKSNREFLINEILKCRKNPFSQIRAVIKIKESNPNITIKLAQGILKKKGVSLSARKIWTIWQDWGYAGFNKKYISNMYIKSLYISNETKMITEFLKKHKDHIPLQLFRKILFRVPVLNDEGFLIQIEPEILPLHHRLAQLYLNFGKRPLHELIRIARDLKNKFFKKKWIYSFLRANFAEIFILDWMGHFDKEYRLIKNTEPFYLRLQDAGLSFSFFMCKARCCQSLLKSEEAKNALQICKNVLKNLSAKPLALLSDMATLATSAGFIKDAEKWLQAMEKSAEHKQLGSFYMAKLASKLANGEFNQALEINERTRHIWGYESRIYLIKAQQELLRGNPEQAIDYAARGLRQAQSENILPHLSRILLITFGAKYALGQKKEVERTVSDYLPIFKKNSMVGQVLTFDSLIRKKFNLPGSDLTPPQKLLLILCQANQGPKYFFKRAMDFAVKNKILGIFLLYTLFFPDLVNSYLKKGKRLNLPSGYLLLPAFNTAQPYYEILLLGQLRILRNNIPIRPLNLRPKEGALLAYLSLFASQDLNIEGIYQNFWPDKKNARQYFYQTISRIRLALKLPGNSLKIKKSKLLIHYHFTTDWLKFNDLTSQAKALILANEHRLALKKYTEALKLYRGEPFKKNFDEWSMQMRQKILLQFENEAINFVRYYIEQGNKNNARKILQKVLKIIPHLRDAPRLLETL